MKIFLPLHTTFTFLFSVQPSRLHGMNAFLFLCKINKKGYRFLPAFYTGALQKRKPLPINKTGFPD
jgi:hypothetical protein